MSQPTLNSSFSGINLNRASRLSYTSLRAPSGDNSINEQERLSSPNVHTVSGSPRGSLTMDQGSSRHSQPDVRRFILRQDVTGKRERLSQPTLVTGDYYPARGQQRLSQPCLTTGRELNPPAMVFHSPSPPPLKHKRFSPAIHASQRERLSQLDIGAKYRHLKESSANKFNRDRFSIPELETQNDLRLIAGSPKQRFSLDSQLTRSQEVTRSRLLPIASSPINENQQPKIEELGNINSIRHKSPTREGLEKVLLTSTTPILPPSERKLLVPETVPERKGTGSTASQTIQSLQQKSPIRAVTAMFSSKAPPIPIRERMSVPEIRNSSLRRLLDPPVKQRHSITGNLRHSIASPIKPFELTLGKKSSKFVFEEALERFKKLEQEENCKNEEPPEDYFGNIMAQQEPKHIQRHYSYTYETNDDSSSLFGKLTVSTIPKKKYLESNFDENEQVITTVIESDVPVTNTPKYTKRVSTYSSETPKWIRKYLENESPKNDRKNTTNKEKASKRSSRRKSSLEYMECPNDNSKARSKSVSSGERSPMLKCTGIQQDMKGMKNTYVKIVPSNNAQESRYEVGLDSTWTDTDIHGFYGDDGDDTDTDDSTSI